MTLRVLAILLGVPLACYMVCRPLYWLLDRIIYRNRIETAFYGRSGKGKVRASAQQLADILDAKERAS